MTARKLPVERLQYIGKYFIIRPFYLNLSEIKIMGNSKNLILLIVIFDGYRRLEKRQTNREERRWNCPGKKSHL